MVGWHDVVRDRTLVAVADGPAFPSCQRAGAGAAGEGRGETSPSTWVVQPATPAPAPRHEPASDTRFDALLRQYAGLLRRTIQRVCPRDMGLCCDDIEQEARISLWKAMKSGRDIASPVSYVYKVAVSVTLRAIRRAQARREEAIVEERDAVRPLYAPATVSPHTAAVMRECREKVSTALARLAANRRLAVELHLQGLTTREIGDILTWSEPKARNLVHRGLKDLRSSLRDMGIEYAW